MAFTWMAVPTAGRCGVSRVGVLVFELAGEAAADDAGDAVALRARRRARRRALRDWALVSTAGGRPGKPRSPTAGLGNNRVPPTTAPGAARPATPPPAPARRRAATRSTPERHGACCSTSRGSRSVPAGAPRLNEQQRGEQHAHQPEAHRAARLTRTCVWPAAGRAGR